MQVTAYKTKKIQPEDDLYKILDEYLPALEEKSVVLITSNIVGICQGNVMKNDGTVDKVALIKKEADWYYIDENLASFGILIPTITNDILIANAGIDESNANGNFVFWPKNLPETTIHIWEYLRSKQQIQNLGVIITDSRLTPLRWGTHGAGIAWCGFEPLKDYRGKPDIFEKALHMTQENILDGLAASAVTVMGEGNEQTPLAIVTDVPFVQFQDCPPTKEEQDRLRITKEDDLYGKLLTSVKWQKGGGGK